MKFSFGPPSKRQTIKVDVDMHGPSIDEAFQRAGEAGVGEYLADKGFWEAVTQMEITGTAKGTKYKDISVREYL